MLVGALYAALASRCRLALAVSIDCFRRGLPRSPLALLRSRSTQVNAIFLLLYISSVPPVSLFMDGDDAACYGPNCASISRGASATEDSKVAGLRVTLIRPGWICMADVVVGASYGVSHLVVVLSSKGSCLLVRRQPKCPSKSVTDRRILAPLAYAYKVA